MSRSSERAARLQSHWTSRHAANGREEIILRWTVRRRKDPQTPAT